MRKATVVITALVTLLTGCKINVTPELYLSDVRDIASNETTEMMTPAAITVQIPSTEKCDEYTAKIGEVLVGILENYETRGCVNEDVNSWLKLEAQVPIIHTATVDQAELDDSSLALFGVFVAPLLEGRFKGKAAVCLYINRTKYQHLNKRMRDAFYQSVDLAGSTMGLLLNNDEKETVMFNVGGTFLNGAPVFEWRQFSLERRRSAELAVSDVGAASLEAGGAVCPLVLAI